MKGIVRIDIKSRWGGWRVKKARARWPVANTLYRREFARLGMPLLPGEEIIECSKEEVISRYDWQEGIDVLLHFIDGTKATMQEKFLFFDWEKARYPGPTATFEESKTGGESGAWYYCTAQYYFVGYDRKEELSFQEWVLLDLPGLHRADASLSLPWKFNQNDRDRRRAIFRYLFFQELPISVVIATNYIPLYKE